MNKKIFILYILTIYYFLQDSFKKVIPSTAELISALVSSYSAHISTAYIFFNLKKHFSTYYKIIQLPNFNYLNIYRRILLFVINFILHSKFNIYLCLDDTFSPRFSKKAPNAHFISKKGAYLLAQVRIVISIIIEIDNKKIFSIPILVKLVDYSNANKKKNKYNTTKLTSAAAMIRLIDYWLKDKFKKKLILLTDAWYMRKNLVMPAVIKHSATVIGRVRKDTVLHLPIEKKKGKTRGRPRKYGEKVTKDYISKLPLKKMKLFLYSQCRTVEYKSIIVYPRFLLGKIKCKAVYVRIESLKQKKYALILCTDHKKSEEEIIKSYAKRWKIETMFRELKQIFGLNELWQQEKMSLNKMTSLVMSAYSATSILNYWSAIYDKIDMSEMLPWRKKNVFTVGVMKVFLFKLLCKYNVRKEISKIYKEKIDFEEQIWGYFRK